jgi:tryptophan-rich sensory protein
MSWLIAVSVAAVCACLEASLSGRSPFGFLKSLKQPPWALPTWGWVIVGGLFYVAMTVALAHAIDASGWFPAALITLVLVTDAFWNYVLFRKRNLSWAYWYLFPYAALVALACAVAFSASPVSGTAIALYLMFLPYDFAWVRSLARLNGSKL